MIATRLRSLPSSLVANIDESELARIEDLWRWKIGDAYSIVAITVFGDLVLAGPGGSPALLDMVEGSLVELAATWEDLAARLLDEAARDEWFLEGIAVGLRAKEIHLGSGECYGFALPPIVGGAIALDNISVVPVMAYQTVMSTVHQQVLQMPPGATFGVFLVDGKPPKAGR